MPARPAGCYRLRQRAGSADLNHMIDTASVRQILCLLAPVGQGLVINDGVGPETLELFQFSSEEEVAITRAPAAFANCSANSDTPPVPRISTVSPGFTWPHTTKPLQAVTPAQVSVAASTCV